MQCGDMRAIGVMTANPTTVELGDSTNGLENDGGSLSF